MLTVVSTTRNRAVTLAATLTSYRDLAPVEGGWRLVVVDNGSTDATAQTLAQFAEILPLTVLRQERPGQNAARNTALDAAAAGMFDVGDLIVFTDDDVFPHRDWLVVLAHTARTQPRATMFAGRILPRWPAPPPDWILRYVPKGPVFSLTDEDTHRDGLLVANLVFSPNMAIRADIFARGIRFDEGMGRPAPLIIHG